MAHSDLLISGKRKRSWEPLVAVLSSTTVRVIEVSVPDNCTVDDLKLAIIGEAVLRVDVARLAVRRLIQPIYSNEASLKVSELLSLSYKPILGSSRQLSIDAPTCPAGAIGLVAMQESSSSSLPCRMTPRNDIVKQLFHTLLEAPYLLYISGPPGTGKTSLLRLLSEYIRSHSREPVRAVFGQELKDLPQDPHPPILPRQYIFIERGKNDLEDEQHGISVVQSPRQFGIQGIIITSSSSSGSTSKMLQIPADRVISLHPKPNLPGLLFTRQELEELMTLKFVPRMTKPFLDELYRISSGHIGAIKEFCAGLESSECMTLSGSNWTWENFTKSWSPEILASRLTGPGSLILCGLVDNPKRLTTTYGDLFRLVLSQRPLHREVIPSNLQSVFEEALSRGSLIVADDDPVTYTFASPLHEWCLQMILPPSQYATQMRHRNLKQFALDALRQQFQSYQFSPTMNLAQQLRDAFYRSCCELVHGGLITYPEFGTSDGRICYWLSDKGWGIEVTHDGAGLDLKGKTHVRFPRSGQFRDNIKIEDYLVVNFCFAGWEPQAKASYDILHIVCRSEAVKILDSDHDQVETFPLAS